MLSVSDHDENILQTKRPQNLTREGVKIKPYFVPRTIIVIILE